MVFSELPFSNSITFLFDRKIDDILGFPFLPWLSGSTRLNLNNKESNPGGVLFFFNIVTPFLEMVSDLKLKQISSCKFSQRFGSRPGYVPVCQQSTHLVI